MLLPSALIKDMDISRISKTFWKTSSIQENAMRSEVRKTLYRGEKGTAI